MALRHILYIWPRCCVVTAPWFKDKPMPEISLKLRLNLLITLLLLLVMLLGVVVLVNNARANVRAETRSTAALAEQLLSSQTVISPYARATDAHRLFRLEKLSNVRHLRIEFYDAYGNLLDSNQSIVALPQQARPPAWFSRLMTSVTPEFNRVRRDVVSENTRMGELVITPDASTEIKEVWDDTVELFYLVLLFFVLVNVMVYWAVDRALKPVDRILAALNEFESGNLGARMPAFRLPELARISHKFNLMAETLEHSVARNHRLSQKLIHLQEEERKSLARDLHDEMGQRLTAILVDATAVLEQVRKKAPEAVDSAEAIIQVARESMASTGNLLQQLRPGLLDELGLRAALEELVSTWREQDRSIVFITRIAGNLDNLGDTTNITAYRVVQECLTNIRRHARPRRAEVAVQHILLNQNRPMLEIAVNDDGQGFDPQQAEGFGLAGMRERVEGLGGIFSLRSAPGAGTQVRVLLPLDAEKKGEHNE